MPLEMKRCRSNQPSSRPVHVNINAVGFQRTAHKDSTNSGVNNDNGTAYSFRPFAGLFSGQHLREECAAIRNKSNRLVGEEHDLRPKLKFF
jgi:hypothetical protein